MDTEKLGDIFVYEPISAKQEIRTFEILLGEGPEMISISMQSQSFKKINPPSNADGDNIPYTAISYSWGDINDTTLIACNGRNLWITTSLHGALWRLRENHHRGQIWADGISINQLDLSEKTEQIRMMGEIYERAEQVFIWLGEEEEFDSMGLELMYYIIINIDEEDSSVTGRPSPDLATSGLALTQVPDAWWQALLSIMRRPWFWRSWVLQEYLRAQKRIFQCGRLEISAEILLAVYHRITNHHALGYIATMKRDETKMGGSIMFGPLFGFEDVGPGQASLTELLYMARELRSSDPKDRLFSLVALSSDTPADFIDYKRDFSDLLREMTRTQLQSILASSNPSEVFEYISLVSNNDCGEGRSSWAPFFELPGAFQHIRWIFPSKGTLSTKPEINFNDSKTLEIKGRVFDSIVELLKEEGSKPAATSSPSRVLEASTQFKEVLAFYRKVESLILRAKEYPTGQDLYEVFWRSLIFNTERPQVEADPEMAECFELNREANALVAVLMERMSSPSGSNTTAEDVMREARSFVPGLKWSPTPQVRKGDLSRLQAEIKDYADSLQGHVERWARAASFFKWGRLYFVSDLGYVGWVPEHAEEGDLICSFAGSRFPFVIRPYQQGHRLIGACYMHGIMEGEAIDLPSKHNHKEDFIRLI